MSKRISKRVREEAAFLCAMMASSSRDTSGEFLFGLDGPFTTTTVQRNFGEPCHVLGVDVHDHSGPAELARLAYWSFARYGDSDEDARTEWAEAESLLRCGWSPGDEP